MNHERYSVYIITNTHKTVLYTGVTSNLNQRLIEHENGIKSRFTKKYKCHYLIYYEFFRNILSAIAREKEIKKWRREKKEKLITEFNPEWKFLNSDINKDR